MREIITIYTSIAPKAERKIRGIDCSNEYLEACVDSWCAAGFRIVSVNSSDEIDLLRSRFSNVELRPNGTANSRTTIEKMMSLISERGDSVAGIINADCLLLHPNGLFDSILEEAKSSIIMFERLNLSQDNLRPTGEHCFGFDAFFFDTKFITKLNFDIDWSIGQTSWDYWFPVAMFAAGARPKSCVGGILHLNHNLNWSWSNWNEGICRLRASLLKLASGTGMLPLSFSEDLRRRQTKGEFSIMVFETLRTLGEQVRLGKAGTESAFLMRVFAALFDPFEPNHRTEAAVLNLIRGARFQGLRLKGKVADVRMAFFDKPVREDDFLHEIFEAV
jgi:hypothetical protein